MELNHHQNSATSLTSLPSPPPPLLLPPLPMQRPGPVQSRKPSVAGSTVQARFIKRIGNAPTRRGPSGRTQRTVQAFNRRPDNATATAWRKGQYMEPDSTFASSTRYFQLFADSCPIEEVEVPRDGRAQLSFQQYQAIADTMGAQSGAHIAVNSRRGCVVSPSDLPGSLGIEFMGTLTLSRPLGIPDIWFGCPDERRLD